MSVRLIAVGAIALTGCASSAPKGAEPELRTPGQTTFELEADPTPEIPKDFTPPPQLPDPLPGDPRAFGAAYLEKVGAEIGPRWSGFLEDLRVRLPPTHELNDSELVCVVGFVVAGDGAISEIAVTRASGVAAFDAAVLEVLADASPLPEPSDKVAGDDDVVRLAWLFARDARQAGVATARVKPVRFPAAQAVPRLVSKQQFAAAAARIAAEKMEPDSRVALVDTLASAVVASAAAGGDSEAIDALSAAELAPIASELRKIAQTDGAPARGAAIAALGRIGDSELAAIAVDAVGTLKTPDAVVRRAASAWAGLGESAVADIANGVSELLASGDPLKRRRAFTIASAVALDSMKSESMALLASDEASMLVAPVLVRLAIAGDRKVQQTVAKALRDKVADRRAAFATSLAAADGPLPARLRSSIERALKDEDERVRGAAIAALSAGWPTRVGRVASRLRGESSPLVLVALAHALGRDRSSRATRVIAPLLERPEPSVRAAAARAMWGRKGAEKALAGLVGDSDERVARAALPGAGTARLKELATEGSALSSWALAASLSTEIDPWLAAQTMAAGDGDLLLEASLAWLAARKRATLSG